MLHFFTINSMMLLFTLKLCIANIDVATSGILKYLSKSEVIKIKNSLKLQFRNAVNL